MNNNLFPDRLPYLHSPNSDINSVFGSFPLLCTPESTHAFAAAMTAIPNYLRDLVYAIVDATGAHPAMALSTLLSGMAGAAHGRYVVQGPTGRANPLGLFMVILSGRTTGKSSVFDLVFDPHREEALRRYRASQARKTTRSKRRGALDEDEPRVEPARFRDHLLQDVTKRGLLEALEGIGEAATIAAHDGQLVLKSPLFRRDLATVNELFDGNNASSLRRSDGDVLSAFKSSLNLLIMAQPEIAGEFHKFHGSHARSIGFDARCLYTLVPLVHPEPTASQPAACFEAYCEQTLHHLSERLQQLEAGLTDPAVLHLSDDAHQLWKRLVVTHRQLAEGPFFHVQDAADRAPQQALRLAANIHCYSRTPGPISRDSMNAGWLLSQWYLREFACAFKPMPALPIPALKLSPSDKRLQREQEDCRIILETIRVLCRQLETKTVSKEKVYIRSGLYHARFRTALMRLTDEGEVIEERTRRTTLLSIASHVVQFPIGQPRKP